MSEPIKCENCTLPSDESIAGMWRRKYYDKVEELRNAESELLRDRMLEECLHEAIAALTDIREKQRGSGYFSEYRSEQSLTRIREIKSKL